MFAENTNIKKLFLTIKINYVSAPGFHMGGLAKTTGKPYVSEWPPLDLHWNPVTQGDQLLAGAQNLTFSRKPLETLQKEHFYYKALIGNPVFNVEH